jgi:hypothetical protein
MKKVKKLSIGLLFVSIAIFMSSCATLLSGTQDRIVINTTPADADVYIDGKQLGKSGQDILLKRKYTSTRQVNLRKEGYEDLNFGIDQKITGEYWLGYFGAGLPMLIDISTGAALKPKQTEFNRVLTPKK